MKNGQEPHFTTDLKKKADRIGLSYSFFHLDLVDLNPEELVFEIIIARKLVSIFYVFAFWGFGENSCFPTGQGLQSTPQFTVLCIQWNNDIIEVTFSSPLWSIL